MGMMNKMTEKVSTIREVKEKKHSHSVEPNGNTPAFVFNK